MRILNLIKAPKNSLFWKTALRPASNFTNHEWGVAFGFDTFFKPGKLKVIEHHLSKTLRTLIWNRLTQSSESELMFPMFSPSLIKQITDHLAKKYPEKNLEDRPWETEEILASLPNQGDAFVNAFGFLRAQTPSHILEELLSDDLFGDNIVSHTEIIRRIVSENGRVFILKNVLVYNHLPDLILKKTELSPEEIARIKVIDIFHDTLKIDALEDATNHNRNPQNFLLVDTNQEVLSDAHRNRFATSSPNEDELNVAVNSMIEIQSANSMISWHV